MNTELRGKSLITLRDWKREDIDTVINVSIELKRQYAMGLDTDYLRNKTMFLMFFEESTRTRNSMEAGIAQLGGHANYLDSSTMQIAHGEVAKDTAIILSRFGHGIACRNCFWGIGNKYLNDMDKWATVPVINMQDDLYHPLQALADLMVMREKSRVVRGQKVSIIWAYAETHKKPISVPLSQALLFPRFGMEVTLAHPKGYELPDWVIKEAKKNALENGGTFKVTNNETEAYENADYVIPKNWGNWVSNPGKDVIDDLLTANKSWKCTAEKMAKANKNVKYMHALPADRVNEVEDSVIDGIHSIIYDEAENRLHTSKAIMQLTMGGK